MDTVNSECASNLTMLRSVLLRDEVVTCPLQEVLLPIDTPSGEKTDLDLVQFKLKMRVKTFRFKNKNAVFKMNTKYILFSHTMSPLTHRTGAEIRGDLWASDYETTCCNNKASQ